MLIILAVICLLQFTTSDSSLLCSIPLLCEYKQAYSYPNRNTTELLLQLPQYPVDTICLQLQAQQPQVTASSAEQQLFCYDFMEMEWILFALPYSFVEGYYLVDLYSYQRVDHLDTTTSSTIKTHVSQEKIFIQSRTYPEYDSAYVQVISLPYGIVTTEALAVPLFNSFLFDQADLSIETSAHRELIHNEILTFHPSSYDIQHLTPKIQSILFATGHYVETASFFFQVYYLQYQGNEQLTSVWPVRNTLPSPDDVYRRISSQQPQTSFERNEKKDPDRHWRIGRGDQGYMEIVISPEDIAQQRYFQSYYNHPQQRIIHQHRKSFVQRQQWYAEYIQQLQDYFQHQKKSRQMSLPKKTKTSIELCIFTANQIDGQKQIWLQQMKYLSTTKFDVTFVMGFDHNESYVDNTLSTETRYGSNSMFRILQAMMTSQHNIRIVDNSGNYAAIVEERLKREQAPDEIIPFGQQWDYQNYSALYEYIHHRYEIAQQQLHQMQPLWCREFYQVFVDMLAPLQCDMMVLGNMKGFTSDIFLVDIARHLHVPMIYELTSLNLHPMMLPDVIIAPSHYAMFEPTVQLPLRQSQQAGGVSPVFTVISPSIDFNLFNPALYTDTYLYPPPHCPTKSPSMSEKPSSVSLWKYEPCVVIGFIARVVPGKSPGLFMQAAYHILQRFPFARFRIIGSLTLEYDMKALAKRLGLSHAVDFVGWVDPTSLPGHLSDIDIVINPSLRSQSETFCIANIEVMSMNIPIVTFAIGGKDCCVMQ